MGAVLVSEWGMPVRVRLCTVPFESTIRVAVRRQYSDLVTEIEEPFSLSRNHGLYILASVPDCGSSQLAARADLDYCTDTRRLGSRGPRKTLPAGRSGHAHDWIHPASHIALGVSR